MKQADISIIIPCYNSGEFLPEAIDSVRNYRGKYQVEIVLVDDGSNDKHTLQVLENYCNAADITFVRQENKGHSAARNTGAQIAKSQYLLFLDSDNRIFPQYIDTGIEILEHDAQIGVVYGKPYFFGDGSRKGYTVENFDIDNLLIRNYIDTCAVLRKKVWEDTGGFDTQLKCFVDWDFWLSAVEKGWKFRYVPQTLYEYRIVSTSVIGSGKSEIWNETARKIRCKHHDLFLQRFEALKQQNDKINNSPEMKTGQFLLKPARWVQNIFKK